MPESDFSPIPVRIVLVRPQGASNIGSVARVMRNFGLNDLALVSPRVDPLSTESCMMACSAQNILSAARIFPSLGPAVSNCRWICATTARVGERRRAELTPRLAASKAAQSLPAAFVFGPEECGLAKEEIDLCHSVLSVPTSTELRSLNLAQAVGILVYELWVELGEGGNPEKSLGRGRPDRPDRIPAHAEEIESAIAHLDQMLEAVGYYNQGAPEHPLREIRRFLSRANPTRYEIAMLRGIFRKTLNCLGKRTPKNKNDQSAS